VCFIDCATEILERIRKKSYSNSKLTLLETATGWTTGVLFPETEMVGFSLSSTTSRPALGPTQPPIRWVPGAFTPRAKRPGREADHLPLCSAEVKNAWSYTYTPPIRFHGVVNYGRDVFMAWCFVKQRDKFIFHILRQILCNELLLLSK